MLTRAPSVGQAVLVKPQGEPVWLLITSVNDPARKITGTVQGTTIAVNWDAGSSQTVDYNDVVAIRGSVPSSLPQAGHPARPSGRGVGRLDDKIEG